MRVLAAAMMIVLGMVSCSEWHQPIVQYKTKVTFCDSRQPDTIVLDYPAYSSEISTYKLAVPEWRGYLNVCALNIIQIDTIRK